MKMLAEKVIALLSNNGIKQGSQKARLIEAGYIRGWVIGKGLEDNIPAWVGIFSACGRSIVDEYNYQQKKGANND